MLSINLLPWREKRRQKIQKHFLLLSLLASIISIFVMVSSHIVLKKEFDRMLFQNEKAISSLKDNKKKIELIEKMKARVDFLQKKKNELILIDQKRFFVVESLRQLSVSAHGVVQFTQVHFEKSMITLYGFAEQRALIKQFLDSLEKQACFQLSKIRHAQACEKTNWQYCFVIETSMECPENLIMTKSE